MRVRDAFSNTECKVVKRFCANRTRKSFHLRGDYYEVHQLGAMVYTVRWLNRKSPEVRIEKRDLGSILKAVQELEFREVLET